MVYTFESVVKHHNPNPLMLHFSLQSRNFTAITKNKITVSISQEMFVTLVFNDTFKGISVILWQPNLLMEETGVPGENH
jgi:hypothetical protein